MFNSVRTRCYVLRVSRAKEIGAHKRPARARIPFLRRSFILYRYARRIIYIFLSSVVRPTITRINIIHTYVRISLGIYWAIKFRNYLSNCSTYYILSSYTAVEESKIATSCIRPFARDGASKEERKFIYIYIRAHWFLRLPPPGTRCTRQQMPDRAARVSTYYIAGRQVSGVCIVYDYLYTLSRQISTLNHNQYINPRENTLF